MFVFSIKIWIATIVKQQLLLCIILYLFQSVKSVVKIYKSILTLPTCHFVHLLSSGLLLLQQVLEEKQLVSICTL